MATTGGKNTLPSMPLSSLPRPIIFPYRWLNNWPRVDRHPYWPTALGSVPLEVRQKGGKLRAYNMGGVCFVPFTGSGVEGHQTEPSP